MVVWFLKSRPWLTYVTAKFSSYFIEFKFGRIQRCENLTAFEFKIAFGLRAFYPFTPLNWVCQSNINLEFLNNAKNQVKGVII